MLVQFKENLDIQFAYMKSILSTIHEKSFLELDADHGEIQQFLEYVVDTKVFKIFTQKIQQILPIKQQIKWSQMSEIYIQKVKFLTLDYKYCGIISRTGDILINKKKLLNQVTDIDSAYETINNQIINNAYVTTVFLNQFIHYEIKKQTKCYYSQDQQLGSNMASQMFLKSIELTETQNNGQIDFGMIFLSLFTQQLKIPQAINLEYSKFIIELQNWDLDEASFVEQVYRTQKIKKSQYYQFIDIGLVLNDQGHRKFFVEKHNDSF